MPLNKASFPVPPAGESAATIVSVDLRGHLLFSAWSILLLLVLNSALRLALLIYNSDQIGVTPALTFAEAFFNGLRFDLRLVAAACFPLLLALLSDKAMAARAFFCFWLTGVASITLLLGIIELDFYREFNQRLNGLVFQYLKEDAKTVLSMLWFGFPVLRYLLAWAIVTWLLARVFRTIDRRTRLRIANPVDLATTLQRLLGDAEKRRRMGENALGVDDAQRGAAARTLDIVHRVLAGMNPITLTGESVGQREVMKP